MSSHRTPAERLAELEARKRRLEERITALSAREKEQRRKDDDRRRVLLGSIVLTDLQTNESLARYMRNRLPSVMKRGDERLFVDLLKDDAR